MYKTNNNYSMAVSQFRLREQDNRGRPKAEKGECWRCHNTLSSDDYADDFWACSHCGQEGRVRQTGYKRYGGYR